MSAESEVLHQVIEGDEESVMRLLALFFPGELQQFRQQLVRTITCVDRERDRRRRGLPVADTGEINVVRGRE